MLYLKVTISHFPEFEDFLTTKLNFFKFSCENAPTSGTVQGPSHGICQTKIDTKQKFTILGERPPKN